MDRAVSADRVPIGDCVLDVRCGALMRGGGVVAVRAKTFALLVYLAGNRGRVISKDELIAAIWPDVIVSEDSLTQCVRDLRKALGDEKQQWIRTLSRRGYMLAEDVDAPVPVHPLLPEGEPIVAILPFAVVGDVDPVLFDGIVEEVINGLARFKTVTVIARASAFTFPVANRPSPQQVGLQLGADHLVEGTFRRTPKGYRISVTLTYAPEGRQVWGDQFDCSEAELLDIDAEITLRIVTRLVANIEQSILGRRGSAPATSLRAFEHLARGRMLLRGYGEDNNLAARDCFLKALAIDPEFALAHAYLALADVIIADYGTAPWAVLEAARARAARAVVLSPEDARCHRIMALVQTYMQQHGAAEVNMRRALDINPYDADTLAQLGFLLVMRGLPADGMALLERAIKLNPFRPPWYDSDLSFAHYTLGSYTRTIDILVSIPERGILQQSRLAAAYAMSGDLKRAAAQVGEAIGILGDMDLIDYIRQATQFERFADLDHLLEGIGRALDAYRAAGRSPNSVSARSSAE